MKAERIEKELFKYIFDSLPYAVKKGWPVFFILLIPALYFSHEKIQELPKRYSVTAIIKTGKIEKRSYKSRILDDLNKVTDNEPMEYAVGLSSSDLEILLKNKYTNHRSSMRKMTDAGPFITDIKIPLNSKLIVIKGEGVDIKKVEETVNLVIKDLKDRFEKEKNTVVSEVSKRLDILKSDHTKVKRSIRKLATVEREVGYSPVLSKQKNDLMVHETKLRYMLIDVEGQLNSDNISQFKILSIAPSKYPVTTRKIVFYIVIVVTVILLSLLFIIFFGIFSHQSLPPVLPDFSEMRESGEF